MKDRIILFGGTFDPVHLGHTTVAGFACEQIGADEVVFIPAKRSPHKNVFPVASGACRVEMLMLAVAGNAKFSVSSCELERPDPSYTFETVSMFAGRYGPKAQLYWLVGTDAVGDLCRWHRVERVLDICNLCVMYRAGYPEPDFSRLSCLGAERVEKLSKNAIATPLVDISSTEIRRKFAAAEDVTGLLSPAVLDYIEKNGLYR
ncbi:MAG: nicotinate-nucleotide adenylyltransferase [Planctomycetes bacterium]|nr:nicotinate-nucleotide adenylyltransferase [Planctomycetota bacterium]